MKKFLILLLLLMTAAWSFSAEVKFTDFSDLAGAEKLSWHPRSTAELSVPRAGVLRAQGKNAKRFCGMEMRKVPELDCSGAIKCDVRMNFGKHVYFALSSSEGYFDIYLPIAEYPYHNDPYGYGWQTYKSLYLVHILVFSQ